MIMNPNTLEDRNTWSANHAAKVIKSEQGYDWARDRKDKRLFDYEQDIEDGEKEHGSE